MKRLLCFLFLHEWAMKRFDERVCLRCGRYEIRSRHALGGYATPVYHDLMSKREAEAFACAEALRERRAKKLEPPE